MATTSNRSLQITLSQDIQYQQSFSAAANPTSPGIVEKRDLISGFQSITIPTAGGAACKAVTIIPPLGNATTLTLKGVTGDTGIPLHKTDPTTIAFDTTATVVGLTTGGAIAGVTFIWT